jgi:hypothetical protein
MKKITRLTPKQLFYEFTARQKTCGTFTNFCEKNGSCKKGDEINRFGGTNKTKLITLSYTSNSAGTTVKEEDKGCF